ncbi:MAG TPA: hypothetical protein VLI67_11080 [Vicinamibacteria bacterium]|nr:hypothetical protein [Vicinamibacteria bacterium]
MSQPSPAAGTLLVFRLKSDAEQLSQVLEILRQLEITAEVAEAEASLAGPGRVVLRLPADRVVAAALALEHHGFAHLRAYASTD